MIEMIGVRARETMIPAEESFAAWRKDPEYEFARAKAMIEARGPGAGQVDGGR
jgi:hypothetical protein